MQHVKAAVAVTLAGWVFVGAVALAQALKIRVAPLYERVSRADAIVVGKVTGIEKDPVAARPSPAANQKVEYRIASAKITEPLLGVEGLTDIRVGFIAPRIAPPPQGGVPPNVRPRAGPIGRPINLQANLSVGQEGVFFLTKHFVG